MNDAWLATLAPELRSRLYNPHEGAPVHCPVCARERSDPRPGFCPHGFHHGVRVYGSGTGSDPLCAEITLDLGWRVNSESDYDYDHEFSVFDEDGKNITPEHLTSALRDRVVRCYCEACLGETHLDDERMARARTVLELRRAVAKANRIPLDGSAENEAKLDEILSTGKEP